MLFSVCPGSTVIGDCLIDAVGSNVTWFPDPSITVHWLVAGQASPNSWLP
jgi:hypothetical protein